MLRIYPQPRQQESYRLVRYCFISSLFKNIDAIERNIQIDIKCRTTGQTYSWPTVIFGKYIKYASDKAELTLLKLRCDRFGFDLDRLRALDFGLGMIINKTFHILYTKLNIHTIFHFLSLFMPLPLSLSSSFHNLNVCCIQNTFSRSYTDTLSLHLPSDSVVYCLLSCLLS